MEAVARILAEISEQTSNQNIELLNAQLNELVAKANRWINFTMACAWLGFILALLVLAYIAYDKYNDKTHNHVKGVEVSNDVN